MISTVFRARSGSVNGPRRFFRASTLTRTSSRCNACASSSPITPPPTTHTDFGSVIQSNTSSLTMSRSPSFSRHPGGMNGVEPVAMTTRAASISTSSSTRSLPGAMKRARPRIFASAGHSSTVSITNPTNRSRSLRTRCITSLPSMRTGPGYTPNVGASCARCAASAAAINSLLGMQPTRAHVVPYGPDSISTTFFVCSRAARNALMPAVPEPMMATSADSVFT